MALKLVVEKLEEVPELSRALYVQKDGKFHLDLEGYEDPAGLKSALSKERETAKKATQLAKVYEDLGLSAEEIKALVDGKKKADEDKAKAGGEWDKLKTQLNESHGKVVGEKEARIKALEGLIESTLVDGEATKAIAEAKGNATLLRPHIKQFVRVVEEGGKYQIKVVDGKGDPRLNGKGDPMTVAELVGEMRSSDVYGVAFEGTGRGGGGMQPGAGGGGKSITRQAFDGLGPAQRAEAIKSGTVVTD